MISHNPHHHHRHISNPFRSRGRHLGDEDMSSDDAYLSYHDICLMKEDIDCLRNDWLTDNNIAFWEEYLEHETLSKHKNRICLLRPSMVFMILQTSDVMSLKSALPQFTEQDYTHIFLPINNNHDPEEAEGGSHWSLLVISRMDNSAFHYDSLHETNHEEAVLVTEKMSKILGKNLAFAEVADTPQQDDINDCGVHVLLNMEYLATERILPAGTSHAIDLGLKGLKWKTTEKRKDMLEVIGRLRRRATRSRSPALNGTDGTPPRIE